MVLVVVALLLGPWAVIWALNTLFGLSVPYNLQSWLAVIILSFATGSSSLVVNRREEEP